MTTSTPTTPDESWADALRHMAQLHAAMIVAPAGSCAGIKQQMNELERRLGITYEAAVDKGLI
jgi:hypothetical protein